MAPPRNRSSIPNCVKILLPSLTKKPSDTSFLESKCYLIKLTDALVRELLSSPKIQILYNTPTTGTIILPGPTPQIPSKNLKFTCYSTENGDNTVRSFLFSRGAEKEARYIGAIVADMELDISSSTKDTRIASTKAVKGYENVFNKVQELGIMNFNQDGPVKKPRKLIFPANLPKMFVAQSDVKTPVVASSSRDRENRKGKLAEDYISTVLTSGGPTQRAKRGNRETSFCGFPRRIVQVKNVGDGSGDTTYLQNTGNLGNAYVTCEKMTVYSLKSPPVGNLSGGLEDMRKRVVHILATGGGKRNIIRRRVMGLEARVEMMNRFEEVLEEVGSNVNGTWTLRNGLWAEVEEGYEKYTVAEEEKMKTERSKVMNEFERNLRKERNVLDSWLEMFEKERKSLEFHIGTLKPKVGEMDFRNRYELWYPLYISLIAELKVMSEKVKYWDGQLQEVGNRVKKKTVPKVDVHNLQ